MSIFRNLIVAVLTLSFFAVLSLSCRSNQNHTNTAYKENVNEWHDKRISNLKGPEDWLKLSGLYKLGEGQYSFGSDSTNDFVFPPKADPFIGEFIKNDTTITVNIHSDVNVTVDGESVSEVTMVPGNARSGTVLKHGSFVWYLLERRSTYYIRLVDENHPNLVTFDGIERFPIQKKWNITARFKPFDEPKTITVPDILNEGMPDTLYGMLEFSIDGEEYSLAPLNNPKEDDKFFIIFGDKTNGESTYGGGRYIYIPTPDENNITYIDFNKSYNPPCVFTDFATCPLPPAQNRLPIAITAGEKMFNNAQSY